MIPGQYERAREVLGVSAGTYQREIREAFHRLAWEYHPDRNSDPSVQARFEEICAAYRLLTREKPPAPQDLEGPRFPCVRCRGTGYISNPYPRREDMPRLGVCFRCVGLGSLPEELRQQVEREDQPRPAEQVRQTEEQRQAYERESARQEQERQRAAERARRTEELLQELDREEQGRAAAKQERQEQEQERAAEHERQEPERQREEEQRQAAEQERQEQERQRAAERTRQAEELRQAYEQGRHEEKLRQGLGARAPRAATAAPPHHRKEGRARGCDRRRLGGRRHGARPVASARDPRGQDFTDSEPHGYAAASAHPCRRRSRSRAGRHPIAHHDGPTPDGNSVAAAQPRDGQGPARAHHRGDGYSDGLPTGSTVYAHTSAASGDGQGQTCGRHSGGSANAHPNCEDSSAHRHRQQPGRPPHHRHRQQPGRPPHHRHRQPLGTPIVFHCPRRKSRDGSSNIRMRNGRTKA